MKCVIFYLVSSSIDGYSHMILGNSTDGKVFCGIILDIIQRAHEIGLFVTNITSDMGSANQAMWKSFGIGVGRDLNPCVYYIPHPVASDRKLFFFS